MAKMKQELVNGVDMTSKLNAKIASIFDEFKASVKLRSYYPQFTIPYDRNNWS